MVAAMMKLDDFTRVQVEAAIGCIARCLAREEIKERRRGRYDPVHLENAVNTPHRRQMPVKAFDFALIRAAELKGLIFAPILVLCARVRE